MAVTLNGFKARTQQQGVPLRGFVRKPDAPFDPEGSGYDYASAQSAGLEPEMGTDGLMHWPSRDPNTGLMLKGRTHPTWDLAVDADKKMGYQIEHRDGRYYSFKPDRADDDAAAMPNSPPLAPTQVEVAPQQSQQPEPQGFRGAGATGTWTEDAPQNDMLTAGKPLTFVDRAKQFIRDKTGYFEPPIEGPTYRNEKPLTALAGAGGYYTAEALSGLGLNVPDILANKITGAQGLSEAVNKLTGFKPTDKEIEAGENVEFMAGLSTAGKVSGAVINRIAARQALKNILGTGVAFGTRKATEEVAQKVVSGDPIDVEGIHFEGGVGVLFGAGEQGVRQFARFIRAIRAGKAIVPMPGTARNVNQVTARQEVNEVLRKYRETGDRTEWDRIRHKYTGAPTPGEIKPAVTPGPSGSTDVTLTRGTRASETAPETGLARRQKVEVVREQPIVPETAEKRQDMADRVQAAEVEPSAPPVGEVPATEGAGQAQAVVEPGGDALSQNLRELNQMKTELKRRSMIFQADAKERYAKELGLPFDTFHAMSYDQWRALSDDMEVLHDKASAARAAGSPEMADLQGSVKMGQIWDAYNKAHPDEVKAIIDKHSSAPAPIAPPVPPVTPAPAAEGAQAWEMTKAEYAGPDNSFTGDIVKLPAWSSRESKDAFGDYKNASSNAERSRIFKELKALLRQDQAEQAFNHQTSVKQALADGKPVPAAVLRDYASEPWAQAELAKRGESGTQQPKAKTGSFVIPIVDDMLKASSESLAQLRSEIQNPRLGPIEGEKGTILFEWRGKTYKAPEPTEAMFGVNAEADKKMALRSILDKTAVEFSEQPTPRSQSAGTEAKAWEGNPSDLSDQAVTDQYRAEYVSATAQQQAKLDAIRARIAETNSELAKARAAVKRSKSQKNNQRVQLAEQSLEALQQDESSARGALAQAQRDFHDSDRPIVRESKRRQKIVLETIRANNAKMEAESARRDTERQLEQIQSRGGFDVVTEDLEKAITDAKRSLAHAGDRNRTRYESTVRRLQEDLNTVNRLRGIAGEQQTVSQPSPSSPPAQREGSEPWSLTQAEYAAILKTSKAEKKRAGTAWKSYHMDQIRSALVNGNLSQDEAVRLHKEAYPAIESWAEYKQAAGTATKSVTLRGFKKKGGK